MVLIVSHAGFNRVAIKGSNTNTSSVAYSIRTHQKLPRTKRWSFNVKHILSKF
eukprot:UN06639